MSLQDKAVQRSVRDRANEKGTTLIEYAFMIGLVSLAAGFLLPEILEGMSNIFSKLTNTVQSAAAE